MGYKIFHLRLQKHYFDIWAWIYMANTNIHRSQPNKFKKESGRVDGLENLEIWHISVHSWFQFAP